MQAKVTLMDQVTKFNEKNTGHNLLSEGTIYGELTAGSLSKILTHPAVQQVLDDPNVANIFLDVGSGLGCPTFQMALLYPKLVSLGIEVIQNRYAGALTNYFSLIQKEILSDEKISFGCCNALDLTSFNPCTIVYFFHVGLQDILWIEFLKVLNKRYAYLFVIMLLLYPVACLNNGVKQYIILNIYIPYCFKKQPFVNTFINI